LGITVNTERAFQPGFRWSLFDGIVLILGAGLAMGLTRIDWALSVMVAFVVGHFFVFCNVLRMVRRLELIWAGQFLLLSSSTLLIETPTWAQTFLLASLSTVVLSVFQARQPSYHGVLWQRLNPGLPEWWRRNGR
jgi:hypothetical protein